MNNLEKLAVCLAETYDVPVEEVMGLEENLLKLKNNLQAWKDKFEKLNVVSWVNTYADKAPALLEIYVRNSVISYLDQLDDSYTMFIFGNTNVLLEFAPEKFLVETDANYDGGDRDGVFQSWIREAFPGSSPRLSIADFYDQLVKLENCYGTAIAGVH